MTDENLPGLKFEDLELPNEILSALKDLGYERPSPIQEKTIPLVLNGTDIIGQAQTGSGKTAAFALPLLSRIPIEKKHKEPRILVLTPTRELAIQVAEAFKRYAKNIKGFQVLPIYGGQSYDVQIRGLRRGCHTVVGTPGRVIDHIKKKNLDLSMIDALVLDEADEMLRMGFIDDVEWIVENTPDHRQVALFSATMPPRIKKIAMQHLHEPEEVMIQVRQAPAETITQKYWLVSKIQKINALTRILEARTYQAVIIFVRTKNATVEISEKLEARGYHSAPINGDLSQNQRERAIDRLRKGDLDILVATDVAARGLDIDGISHVINYDIPYDTEAYVHRIGRTGRAGRQGEAILFLAPREKRMLRTLEKAIGKKIDPMELPTSDEVNELRITRFKEKVSSFVGHKNSGTYNKILEQFKNENPDLNDLQIAIALACMAQGDQPFLLPKDPPASELREERSGRRENRRSRDNRNSRSRKREYDDRDLENYRIEVGRTHGVAPQNIVGAIANETGLEGRDIGHIKISEKFSTVSLPKGLSKEMLRELGKVWICEKQIKISKVSRGSYNQDGGKPSRGPRRGPGKDNFNPGKDRKRKKKSR